jgi:hypothetical protein
MNFQEESWSTDTSGIPPNPFACRFGHGITEYNCSTYHLPATHFWTDVIICKAYGPYGYLFSRPLICI